MYFDTIKTLDMDDKVMNNTDMVPAPNDTAFSGRLDNMPESKCK